ncbi:MAG: hypothetical protein Q9167_007457 [Letrouitia subvulpina]
MVAGIGEASAILTVAQLGITLSNTLITYIGEVKDAPERIQRIGNEIATTSERLKDIGEIVEKNQTIYIFSDEGVRSALRCSIECKKIIVDLQAILAKGGWRQTSSALEKDEIDISLFSSLKWPFLKTKLEVPRAELQRIKVDLSLLFSSAMALKASKLTDRQASYDLNWVEDDPQLLEDFVAFQEKRYREDEERVATERAAIQRAKIEREKKQEEQVRIEVEKKAIEKYKREQQEAQARTARRKEEFSSQLSNLGFRSEQISSIIEETHLDFLDFGNGLNAQPDRGSTPTTQPKDKNNKVVPDNKSLDPTPLRRSKKRLKFPRVKFQQDHKEGDLIQIILHGKFVDDFSKGGDFTNSGMASRTGPMRPPNLNTGVPETAITPDVKSTLGRSPQDHAREIVGENPFPLLETFRRALEQKKNELLSKKRRLKPSEPGRTHDIDDFLVFLEDQLNFKRDNAGSKAVMPTTRKSRNPSNVNEHIIYPDGSRDQILEDDLIYEGPAPYIYQPSEETSSIEEDYIKKDYKRLLRVPSAAAKRSFAPITTKPPRDNTRPSHSGRWGWQGTETGADPQRFASDHIHRQQSFERLRPKSLQIQAGPAKTRHDSNRSKFDDREPKNMAQQRQLGWSGGSGRRQGKRDSSLQHPRVSFYENDIYGKESSNEADYSKALVRRRETYDNTPQNKGDSVDPTRWLGWNGPISISQGESHSSSSSSTDYFSARRDGSVRQQYRHWERKEEAPQNVRFIKRGRDHKEQDERERSAERDENEVDSKPEISDTEIIKRTLRKFTTFNANELPSRQAQNIYPIMIPDTSLGNRARSQENTSAGQRERNASLEPNETKRTNSEQAEIHLERNTQGGSDTPQTSGPPDHDASQPPFVAGEASTSARQQQLLQLRPPIPREDGQDWHLAGAEVASPVSVSVRSFDSASPRDARQAQESPKRRSTADDLD